MLCKNVGMLVGMIGLGAFCFKRSLSGKAKSTILKNLIVGQKDKPSNFPPKNPPSRILIFYPSLSKYELVAIKPFN
jgi:hypothetical protein